MRRRIDELRRAGLLYFEVDIDNRVLGMNVHAMLWLSVEPARLAEAGRAMAAHPEIPFAAATTGPTNLVASAVLPRHPGALRIPDRRPGRPARGELGADRADHPDAQAHRLSSLAGRRERPPQSGKLPAFR